MASAADETDSTPIDADSGGDAPCWAHLHEPPPTVVDATRADEVRLLTGTADEVLIVCDGDGRITIWDDGARRVLGWTTDEILGTSVELLLPVEDRQAFWSDFFDTLRTSVDPGGRDPRASALITRDGRRIDGTVRLHVLWKEDDSTPTCVAVTVHRDDRDGTGL